MTLIVIVAIVDKNGNVKAIKAGTAKIAATYQGNKYYCKVVVAEVTDKLLSGEELIFAYNGKKYFC